MTFTIKHPSDYRPVFSDPGRNLTVRYGDDPVTFSYPGTGQGHDRVAIIPPRDLPDHDKRRALYRVEMNLNDGFDARTCQAIEREPYVVGVEGAQPRRVCVVTYTAEAETCTAPPQRAADQPYATVNVVSSSQGQGQGAPQIVEMNCTDMAP